MHRAARPPTMDIVLAQTSNVAARTANVELSWLAAAVRSAREVSGCMCNGRGCAVLNPVGAAGDSCVQRAAVLHNAEIIVWVRSVR